MKQKISKYEILGKIGEGGFGKVYKGRDPFIKRLVAIKTCSLENEEARKRFFREAEIAGRFDHPNVTMVHDFGVEAEQAFLVQEYLTGEDLVEKIGRREEIPLEKKVDYLLQTARGLAYAHGHDVIHRDIKPGNIRVLESDQIKIMDFGIAKLTSSATQLTQKGMAVGTVGYLSPEQLTGGTLDHRTDIFSYGVVAYELLAYQSPFKGRDISTVMRHIMKGNFVALTDLLPDCPVALADLVAKCLANRPDSRYPSFDAVAGELEAIKHSLEMGGDVSRTVAIPIPDRIEPPADLLESADTAARPKIEPPVDESLATNEVTAVPDDPAEPAAGRVATTRPVEEIGAGEEPAPPGLEQAPTVLGPLPRQPASTRPQPTAPSGADAPDSGSQPELLEEVTSADEDETVDRQAGELLPSIDSVERPVAPVPTQVPRSPAPPPAPPQPAAPQPPIPQHPASPGAPAGRVAPRRPPDELPAPPAPPTASTTSGRRWIAVAIPFVVIVALAAVGWWWSNREPAQPEPQPVPVETPVAEPEPEPVIVPEVTLAVTAEPWGRVVQVLDESGGDMTLESRGYTPLVLQLPPGLYSVILSHPAAPEPQICQVALETGLSASCHVVFMEVDVTSYFKETGWWD